MKPTPTYSAAFLLLLRLILKRRLKKNLLSKTTKLQQNRPYFYVGHSGKPYPVYEIHGFEADVDHTHPPYPTNFGRSKPKKLN